jgi:site-specific DNA-methyltransferase (adenine-specific)
VIQVIEGDCLAVLPTLEKESFDAIVTDPPYGISFEGGSTAGANRKKFGKILNDDAPFIWFMPGAYRVLKPGGIIHVFCRWDVQDHFRRALKWAGFKVKSEVVWDRMVHGMGDTASAYAPQHDTILFAIKDKYKFPGKRPNDVIRGMRLNGVDKVHPAEKPIELLVKLLEITPSGQTKARILDPFCGSGTTLVAADSLGMDAVGIELDPRYAQIARERIAGYTGS